MQEIDTSKWSGEGTFTQVLIDRLQQIDRIALIRVEDAPASRSEADYNFISNEIFVVFAVDVAHRAGPPLRHPARRAHRRTQGDDGRRSRVERSAPPPDVGAPDYSDEGMLQYLRTERIIPPYQTRGYKLVELVRIYEAGAARRRDLMIRARSRRH